jgi:hypothetical protein
VLLVVLHDAHCELRCITSNSSDDEALHLSPVYAGSVPSFKKERFSARLALVTRRVGCNPVSEQFDRISRVGRHLLNGWRSEEALQTLQMFYFTPHCKGQSSLTRLEHCTCIQESRYNVINGYFVSRYLTCAEVIGYRHGCEGCDESHS